MQKKALKNLDTGLCYSEKQAAAEVCICSNLRFPCPRSAFYLCIHQAPLLHCKSRGYRNGSSTQATQCCAASQQGNARFHLINNVTVSEWQSKLLCAIII